MQEVIFGVIKNYYNHKLIGLQLDNFILKKV